MATQLQFRRYDTANTAITTGAVGELTIDTDKKVVVVHDGVTAGGTPLATQANVTNIAGGNITLSNFSGDILPSANTYKLGSSAKPFASLTVTSTGINIGTIPVVSTGGTFTVTNTNSNIALYTSSVFLNGNGSNVNVKSGDITVTAGVVSGASAVWDFYSNAAVRFPNGRLQSTAYPGVTSSIPTSSKGQSGDLKGLMSSDGTYLYVCFADYTTGTDDIWARISTGGTW